MSSRRIYPKPPIVEAVIELRLRCGMAAAELVAHLQPRLAQMDGQGHRMDQFQLTVRLDGNSMEGAASRAPRTIFLRSNDGLRQIGCGPERVSIHVLAPYPGWENFLQLAREVVAALPDATRQGGFDAILVRYIDRIALPAQEPIELATWLTLLTRRPTSMPARTRELQFITRASDADGTEANLRIVTAGMAPEGRPLLLFDLLMSCFAGDEAVRVEEWEAIVERLHARQRSIFEDSITDALRALFV